MSTSQDISRVNLHQLPHYVTTGLLPGITPELRMQALTEVARHGMRGPWKNWQDMWNSITGATDSHDGSFSFLASIRCPDCNGTLVSRRNGLPGVCHRCVCRGRVTERITVRCCYAKQEGGQP